MLEYRFAMVCEYAEEYKPFFGGARWKRVFYSKYNDPEKAKKEAARYFKKMDIPAVIVSVSDPEARFIFK